MAKPQKYKVSDVVEALQKAHGLKTGAAELLKTTVAEIDWYCDRHKEVDDIVNHWSAWRADRARYKLDEAIERGEAWAIKFAIQSNGAQSNSVEEMIGSE